MPDDTINSRLSRLENDVADLRRDLRSDVKGLHEKVDTILAAVAEMSRRQGMDDLRLRGELEAVKSHMCPNPQSCVSLLTRMDKMEENFSILHNMVEQFKGAYKAGRVFWIGVGACASVIVWFFKDFMSGRGG